MKKSVITSVLAVLAALTTTIGAQNYPKEYLGLPGDNLNLYAVMDLFRNAPTLEAFERSLNDRESRINNLDLNGDWRVDYIAVSDYRDGRVHNIVLRAVLGRNEYQDVAVITVERLKKKKFLIQIIGDELLYGRNYIIEPLLAKKQKVRHEYSPVYYGGVTVYNNYYDDIWDWPVVVHIYSPYYSGWSSSWYWGYYPTWYEPWSPWYWDYYYGYHSGWHSHYHSYYHHSDRYRYQRYNDYYYHSVRQESPQVQRRVAEGNYRQTYSRPEQRAEGMDLQRRTREAITEGTRSQAPANAGTRRQATPQAVSGTVPSEGRRTAAGTEGRRAAETEATRRASTETVSRNAEENGQTRRAGTGTVSREAAGNDATRRSTTGTVSREAATTEEARRAPATLSRTDQNSEHNAQTGETVRRTAASAPVTVKSAESEAAEAREAQAREAQAREVQARENERMASEAREAQQRAAEQRAAEARAEQQRVSEQRAAEAREAQAREVQARENERRASEAREAQQRAAEQRAAESRENERRAAEARENERRAAENRAAQQRTLESGSDRISRK